MTGISLAVAVGAAVASACPFGGSADAGALTTGRIGRYVRTGHVTMAEPPSYFDISIFDRTDNSYLLSDISNGTLDVVSAESDKLRHRVGGFTLPSGIVAIAGSDDVWVGQASSLVKVVNLRSDRVTATISTHGTGRADELAEDPTAHVVAVENDDDSPPFVSFVSTTTRRVVRRVAFPGATDGLEALTWDGETGRFYLSVPATRRHRGGELAVLTASGRLTGTLPLTSCDPSGIGALPGDQLFVSCSASVRILSAVTGRVVHSDPTGASSSDEVEVLASSDRAFSATSAGVAVVDTSSGRLVQMIRTPSGSHSLAVDAGTGALFVPEPGLGAAIYAPTSRSDS